MKNVQEGLQKVYLRFSVGFRDLWHNGDSPKIVSSRTSTNTKERPRMYPSKDTRALLLFPPMTSMKLESQEKQNARLVTARFGIPAMLGYNRIMPRPALTRAWSGLLWRIAPRGLQRGQALERYANCRRFVKANLRQPFWEGRDKKVN